MDDISLPRPPINTDEDRHAKENERKPLERGNDLGRCGECSSNEGD